MFVDLTPACERGELVVETIWDQGVLTTLGVPVTVIFGERLAQLISVTDLRLKHISQGAGMNGRANRGIEVVFLLSLAGGITKNQVRISFFSSYDADFSFEGGLKTI